MTQHNLVICEKPSVAQTIGKTLGATARKDGYLEGGEWLVSWCVGHLVELAQADAYGEQYKKWSYESLPILPHDWQYTVAADKSRQFKILKDLMRRADVSEVVNACDAGREGELIFRFVYEVAKCKKPMRRLWSSSMEDDAIRQGFASLKDGNEYDALFASALCRAKADWIIGINATRLFSTLYRATLHVGRVQSPTLALLVNREKEIAGFEKQDFYTVRLTAGALTAESERLEDREQAETLRTACQGKTARVETAERRERIEAPPRLYDLTALQRDANRLYGYTARQTLDYAQSLYENKLATYPRTDSRYLTQDMAAGLPALVKAAAGTLPFLEGLEIPVNAGQVINGAKVSDHHALLPTSAISENSLTALPDGERAVLRLLCVRLLCAVGEKHVAEETAVTLSCGGRSFAAKGRTVREDGWKAVDRAFRATLKEKPENGGEPAPLPELAQGQEFPVFAAVHQGETTPPKAFTEDALLSAMEAAGAEDMPEDAERRGLGTPATRADIIEKLVKTGYVERKAGKLRPTQKGMNLAAVLPEEMKSPALTAQWETRLKQVERGEYPAEAFMDGIAETVRRLVREHPAPRTDCLSLFAGGQSPRNPVGSCPRCGKPVAEIPKGFVCSDRACGFALWKENRFFTGKKKPLTKETAAALLEQGRVFLSGLYSEKTGKTYDAWALLDDTGGKYVNFKLEFPEKTGGKPSAGRKGGE